jgi:SAM-dependent methyltransferase
MEIHHVIRDRFARWAVHGGTVARLRERRYLRFMELCNVRPSETILDVGAGSGRALARYNTTNPIVAVDLKWPDYSPNWLKQPNVRFVQADATDLPFADREFPIAFSNAVIQCVPKEKQMAFADEIRRVSERYFVQTQNRWFPIRSAVASLTARDVRRLFPDAEIHRERVFGLTKSLMAVRREIPAQS